MPDQMHASKAEASYPGAFSAAVFSSERATSLPLQWSVSYNIIFCPIYVHGTHGMARLGSASTPMKPIHNNRVYCTVAVVVPYHTARWSFSRHNKEKKRKKNISFLFFAILRHSRPSCCCPVRKVPGTRYNTNTSTYI